MGRIEAQVTALALVATLSCASAAKVAPFRDAADVRALAPDEDRVWYRAKQIDEVLARSGQVDGDEELERYVQGVAERVWPEFAGAIDVHVLRSGVVNAFCMPNGSVYVHAGLLARMEDEAELAIVLAHEGAHFVHRHGFESQNQVKSASSLAAVLGVAGIPLVTDLIAISSVYGFSRELEREADRAAWPRYVAAGYAPERAVEAFRVLLAQTRAAGDDEDDAPYFFATHPRLEERIASFEALAKAEHGSGTRVEAAEYARRVGRVRLAVLAEDVARLHHSRVIAALEDDARRAAWPPESAYFLGEAYRQRAKPGDDAKSEALWLACTRDVPRFGPAWRALGERYRKQGDAARAKEHLTRFLELTPTSGERAFVEEELRELDAPAAPNAAPRKP